MLRRGKLSSRRTHRPKLGQHFLADARYRRRILDALDLRADDALIEIGAGRGAMTELLAGRARRVIAIELDRALAVRLADEMRDQTGVEILCADILSTDLAELSERAGSAECFVFGNLPYYVTSPIIHHLFRAWDSIRAMALLVQREVAERLTAAPGRRAYGYLSVLAQFYSEPRVVLSVPPGAFSPAPKVQSALVRFRKRPSTAGRTEARLVPAEHESEFLEFVKRCFAQKRKNLLNNLTGDFSRARVEAEIERLALPLNLRGEQLSVEQLATLYRRLEAANSHVRDG